jgi:hypothetical protein
VRGLSSIRSLHGLPCARVQSAIPPCRDTTQSTTACKYCRLRCKDQRSLTLFPSLPDRAPSCWVLSGDLVAKARRPDLRREPQHLSAPPMPQQQTWPDVANATTTGAPSWLSERPTRSRQRSLQNTMRCVVAHFAKRSRGWLYQKLAAHRKGRERCRLGARGRSLRIDTIYRWIV